jgi:hypothetical protein
MSACRTVNCAVTNESKSDALVLVEATLDHGVWSGSQPPSRIAPGGNASFGSESDGFMTGTEGHATYAIGDTGAKLTLYWNNPFVGANGFTQTIAPGPGGAGVAGYELWDPMRPDDVPRFLSGPPAFEHGNHIAVRYRFRERDESSGQPIAPVSKPAGDTQPVSAPAGKSTPVSCPAGVRKVCYIGLTYNSAVGESDQLKRVVPKDLTIVTPHPKIDSWLLDDDAFAKRTPRLDRVRDKLKALEAADDPVETTLGEMQPPKPVGPKPRILVIRALAKMLGEVDADLNPEADCLAMKRLVLSGHHCDGWTNKRDDVLWGSDALLAAPDQLLTLFQGDGSCHGVLAGLAEIFPKAFAQVEDLCYSACLTGHSASAIPKKTFELFKNLDTLWAYENESGNAAAASDNPYFTTSNRALVDWEKASRSAGSGDAIDQASRAIRAQFKGNAQFGKSIVWVAGQPRKMEG